MSLRFIFIINEDIEIISDGREGEVKWLDLEEIKKEKLIPSDPLMIDCFLNKQFKEVISFVEKVEESYIQDKFFERLM